MNEKHKYRLCILTTVPISIKAFYGGQIEAFNKAGFKTTVICADDPELRSVIPPGTEFKPVRFTRVSNPIHDLLIVWQLYRIFRKNKFDIVQYSTPKASLLGSIASFFAGVPVRIYILWGLYYTGQKGLAKFLFKSFEKLICRISTLVVPISHEMIDFAQSEGLVKKQKCQVMLNGSACGVNLELFEPRKWQNFRKTTRDTLNIPENAVVIGTVARLTGDKGINELVQVFDVLSKELQDIYLLLVGKEEEKNKLDDITVLIIRQNNRIKCTGWQDNPLPYYAAMDIFCLPTYREGFGEVNLEAQAMDLPVVSTNVIGPRESVEDGRTGFLVESKSREALMEPLKKLILNPQLRKSMGERGRIRIEKMFNRKDMIEAVVRHRLSLLNITSSAH